MDYISTTTSFLFSLKNQDGVPPLKLEYYRFSRYAIYDDHAHGPSFGRGLDLVINGDGMSGSSNLGQTYRPPPGYTVDDSKTKSFLAGSFTFKPSAYEVYYKV